MDRCGQLPADKSSRFWRPWDEGTKGGSKKLTRVHPYKRCQSFHPSQSYITTFKHPVRLYWTKAVYDYMYEAGERLLRNFPVQATIQVVDESDSDDSDDEDDDDGIEEESNLDKSLKGVQEAPKDRKKTTP